MYVIFRKTRMFLELWLNNCRPVCLRFTTRILEASVTRCTRVEGLLVGKLNNQYWSKISNTQIK